MGQIPSERGGEPAGVRIDVGFPSGIRSRKTAEIIADRIRKRIIRGELKAGGYLPPEAQLMETLGVSRPTLREAFRILEAENLIRVVRGARTGARVEMPQVEIASRHAGFLLQSQGTTVADVYEARLAIEPFAARQLAVSRSEEAAARLRREADLLTRLVDEGRYVEFMIGLTDFHCAIVELAGNRTLLLMTQMLRDVLARYQVELFTRRPMPPELQRKRALWGLRSFRRLIELIEAGDADGAEAHWRLHTMNSNSSWVEPEDADRLIDIFD